MCKKSRVQKKVFSVLNFEHWLICDQPNKKISDRLSWEKIAKIISYFSKQIISGPT